MELYEKLETDMLDYAKGSMQTTRHTADVLKEGLEHTIEQINKGFKITMYMYLCVFVLGAILILFSGVIALYTNKNQLSLMFGGMGMVNILSFFFSKTPINLQKSRGELAQLQTLIFNWYVDLTNWNSILLQNQNIDLASVKEISDIQMERTSQTIKLIKENI